MPAPDPAAALKKEALAAVRQIYKDHAGRNFLRNCTLRTGCCRFAQTGEVPLLTKGEALLAMQALRATGRRSVRRPADGACPLLDPRTARCLIYEARPFGCRTHFCSAAGGPHARRDVLDLIRRLEEWDARLGGDGPRSLHAALDEIID
ncbi:MAG: YkgJ family cysteine cluster protein [Terrimicrobiaceae bacterium]|nr:YkgJ family cysteine cluster protein [Terrimicrobiaceae bacterium]